MPVTRLHCRETIACFLQRDPRLRLYEIGDLDDFFWPYTTWYALTQQDQIRELAVFYANGACPTLLGLAGQPLEPMRELLQGLLPFAPRRFFAHLSGDLAEVFARDYHVKDHGPRVRMALVDPSRLETVDTSQVAPLTPADADALGALYLEGYPGNWFDPRMLETGQFFGIWRDSHVVSVAGVHVYSPCHNAAALGNVTTHPAYRGQGLATAVCARLCQSLRKHVTNIGLNVKTDNQIAIRCYRRLGFAPIATYGEYTMEIR